MRINARDCIILKIENQKAFDFIEEHHRQGLSIVGKAPLSFGIVNKKSKELYGVAVFCNPKTRGKQKNILKNFSD